MTVMCYMLVDNILYLFVCICKCSYQPIRVDLWRTRVKDLDREH